MLVDDVEICSDLSDVRRNIDEIDHVLVGLIAKRGAYVMQASKFKSTASEVEAPKRVEQVLLKVTELAKIKGANIEVVRSVWMAMISSFIEMEKEEFRKNLSTFDP